jgi:hypothetical protein
MMGRDATRRLLVVATALFMITGLVVLTWSYRDMPIAEQPSWMTWQLLSWPVLVFALLDGSRLMTMKSRGRGVRADWLRILCHAAPACLIVLAPAGLFTMLFGAGSGLSMLDFPAAKTMAALWFAASLFHAVEVTP